MGCENVFIMNSNLNQVHEYIPLEIRTRGVVNSRNRIVLTQLCHGLKVNKVSCVIKNCSKLALLGSYTLWNARYSTDWSGGGYLKP